MMKLFKKKSFIRYVISLTMIITFLIINPGCAPSKMASVVNSEIVVGIGNDQSMSVSGYRRLDTSIIARICRAIAKRGGVVVVYGIGETSDKSGIRCYVKHAPDMDATLTLTKQAELKETIDEVKAHNNRQITEFLKLVEEQVLGPPGKAAPVMHTDINGFFRKVDILFGEPETQQMAKYMFAYTDGIQSIGGHDEPASYNFTSTKNFTLCLAGWKTAMPTKAIEIKQFEDPQGFALYMESVTSLNN